MASRLDLPLLVVAEKAELGLVGRLDPASHLLVFDAPQAYVGEERPAAPRGQLVPPEHLPGHAARSPKGIPPDIADRGVVSLKSRAHFTIGFAQR